MNAKATMYTLATCLVVVSAAAMTSSRSWFEAYTSGARTVALRGKASYGTVGENGSGAFVVTLGANAPEGAVLFREPVHDLGTREPLEDAHVSLP